jgi:Ca-activated chloride channel family protein
MTLTTRIDRGLIRARANSVRYILARIGAPPAPARENRLPVNLAFVLDRSGSMAGDKIRLAREAVVTALRSLREVDRFALVVYDNVVDLVMPSTPAGAEARRRAEELLRAIDARGTTDLGGGWLLGCEQVAQALDDESVARCLLMSDGLANVGITDGDELARHARNLSARGVATSTFGVGHDFDEVLLEQMAREGAGNFYYIESTRQIPDFIASEVGEALEVVAQDVRLEVEAPKGVWVDSLNDLPSSRAGEVTTINLGSLVSEQVLDTVLRVTCPRGSLGEELRLGLWLRDRDGVLGAAVAAHGNGRQADGLLEVAFEYAPHEANNAQPRDRSVDREVARLYAAKARRDAAEMNRRGNFKEAQRILLGTARRIGEYADGDPELLDLVEELRGMVELHGEPMPASMRMMQFAQSSQMLRSRDSQGRAKRK